MGVIPEGKTPTIGYLWPHHRSMARALVAGGLTPGQLAEAYGFSPAQITKIIHSPLFEAEVARLEAEACSVAIDVRRELEALQPLAMEVLSDNLTRRDTDPKLRTNTALEILDRTGFGKKEAPQIQKHLHIHARMEASKASQSELYNDVLNLIEEEDGSFSSAN